jgi:hypothetical protein
VALGALCTEASFLSFWCLDTCIYLHGISLNFLTVNDDVCVCVDWGLQAEIDQESTFSKPKRKEERLHFLAEIKIGLLRSV